MGESCIIFLRSKERTKYRGVEQLVAREAHNLEVVGSSPSSATKKMQSLKAAAIFLVAMKRTLRC